MMNQSSGDPGILSDSFKRGNALVLREQLREQNVLSASLEAKTHRALLTRVAENTVALQLAEQIADGALAKRSS